MAFKKLTLSPESFVYTGEYSDEPLQIEVYKSFEGKVDQQIFSRKDLKTVLKIIEHSPNNAWINVVGLSDVEAIAEIGLSLGLDKLLIEDILNVHQRSKIEYRGSSVFFTLKMLMKAESFNKNQRHLERLEIRKEHVTLIVKNNVLVCFQENPQDVFNGLRKALIQDEKVARLSVDYWAYLMLDAVVDHYMALMAEIGDELDALENTLLETKRMDFESIYLLRKNLLKVKRAALPLKDIVQQLKRSESIAITSYTKNYFVDVDDHLDHILEQYQHFRDTISNIIEVNATESSQKMNRIMMTLTVFSAVFIPLNFMAGFFGMNFKYFPWLNAHNGIPIFIVFSIVMALMQLLVFKKIKW